MKILIGPSTFAELDNAPLIRLRDMRFKIIENPYKRKLTKPELIDLLAHGVTGLIAGLELLDREVLERSDLKVISRCGSGLSNVDLEAAEELGIKVCSTPDAPTEAVAELTLAALLSLLRMIPQMNKDLHEGKWTKKIGTQLKGKIIVIIGYGRIGRRLSQLLIPFKTKIIAVDPYLQGANDDVDLLPLEQALPQADIITLHSSSDTCILSEKEFSLIKPGVFLLNAARGNLMDEAALIRAIEEDRIKGAWIDTFEQEPYTGPLTNYPQVILTPHVGSYTTECRKQMEMEAVDNLIAAIKKEP